MLYPQPIYLPAPPPASVGYAANSSHLLPIVRGLSWATGAVWEFASTPPCSPYFSVQMVHSLIPFLRLGQCWDAVNPWELPWGQQRLGFHLNLHPSCPIPICPAYPPPSWCFWKHILSLVHDLLLGISTKTASFPGKGREAPHPGEVPVQAHQLVQEEQDMEQGYGQDLGSCQTLSCLQSKLRLLAQQGHQQGRGRLGRAGKGGRCVLTEEARGAGPAMFWLSPLRSSFFP